MPVRVRERDLAVPALSIAAARPNGRITTSDLIAELEALFEPDGEDADILDGRHDSKFSQKVRNLISHREGQNSIFSRGYATYDKSDESIQITAAGRAFLGGLPQE